MDINEAHGQTRKNKVTSYSVLQLLFGEQQIITLVKEGDGEGETFKLPVQIH